MHFDIKFLNPPAKALLSLRIFLIVYIPEQILMEKSHREITTINYRQENYFAVNSGDNNLTFVTTTTFVFEQLKIHLVLSLTPNIRFNRFNTKMIPATCM